MFSAFNTFGRLGAPAGRTIAQQIAAMSPSLWMEPSVTNGYQDSAGTTALTQPGAGAADPPVGLVLDLSGNGRNASQSTSTARPKLSARVNLLTGTATLSTQSVTVAAGAHTMFWTGAGTVTASGAYSGALTSGQTFTTTAGTLTLTVAGSVTSAQLNTGSTALRYQSVTDASNYDYSGFPLYWKFDGVDDSLASATFAAGTLTSSMDCLIAVRRDSAANVIFCMNDEGTYFGYAASGGSGPARFGAGAPTIWVDGAQLSGGTTVTTGTLHTALTLGSWHILELRGLDLSAWTLFGFSNYGGGFFLNGALGDILLFAAGQDANRDRARARMAAYFGVTLP